MDLVSYSIRKPISVAVGVIVIVLFGLIGLNKLPVQLTPDVETPQITVKTRWSGATPYEVEKDIVEQQEEVLKGVKNLTLMESSSFNNYGEITLSFKVGTDLDSALLRVSNKLNEVSDYPENADKPVIDAAGAQSSPVIWMTLKTKADNSTPIKEYRTFFENDVRQHLERVDGVGSLFVVGGTEDQLQVTIDPLLLARYNLTIAEVISRLQQANNDVAAGVLGMGKKDYRIRTAGKFESVRDPLDVVLFDDGMKRVLLGDVASSAIGYEREATSVIQNGRDVIVCGVRKEQGANVITLTTAMKQVVEELNQGVLESHDLYFEVVHDQIPYIETSIAIVKKNIIIGGLLAIGVLILFLRSFSSTLTTAIAIPISVIGTFISLWLLGRNLNIVSLAGISFAVGMLVDNAIVVLENIDRHRQMGKTPFAASHEGAKEVWGAVLASTVTTVAVFLPVIFIEQEAGQLFRDIAIAITSSIILSLFVSISVIPATTNQLFRFMGGKKKGEGVIDRFGGFLAGGLLAISAFFLKNSITRLVAIVFFTMLSLSLIMVLMPKSEYLPQGNRNLILNILIPPPGFSTEKRHEVGEVIYKAVQPHLEEDYLDGIPQVKNLFYVAGEGFNLFGAVGLHETEAKKMMPLFSRILHSLPGYFGVSLQAGIFQQRIGRGRTVDVNIAGENIGDIIEVARTLFGAIQAKIPGSQVRPVPSLEISYPEANIIPDRMKLAANGLSETDLGTYVDILMDGRKVGNFKPSGRKEIDLILRGAAVDFQAPEDILDAVLTNKFGDLIRIGDVASLQYDQGMTQIDHQERKRTVKLEVTPPESIALQEAMEIIEGDLIASLAREGKLANVQVAVGGNADKLTQTRLALQWNFLLAVVLIYLLMAALFENFFYPFIILFSVPLAAGGGFVGLFLVNRLVEPQGFDILTMLGFIILVGTVVNNAILIVHQALNNVRYGHLSGIHAIRESVRTRIRPIFMSAATSLFGMLPLVLARGAGSELYRGLGSVLLGGLAFSTLFTLFVIPALLAFFIGFEKSRDTT